MSDPGSALVFTSGLGDLPKALETIWCRLIARFKIIKLMEFVVEVGNLYTVGAII
jgi:hypothetical protein